MNKTLLIVTGIYPPDIGGPASYLPHVVNYMKKNNVSIKIFTYGNKDSYNTESIVIDRKKNIFVREFLSFFLILFFAKNTDVIYTNGNYFKSFLVSIILKKRNVLKIVGDPAWERAKNWGILNTSISEIDKSNNLIVKFFKVIRNIPIKYAHHIITPSNYLNEIVKNWTKNKNISTIYNGVIVNSKYNFFYRDFNQIDKLQLIVISRLVKWKNIDKIIELAKHNDNIFINIIGDGPEYDNLSNKINELNLFSRVKILGNVNDKSTIENYLQHSFCLILNSDYEGLSHVLLESMLCFCPVMCSNVLGNLEVVKHDVNGLTFEVNDIKSILINIEKLKNNNYRKVLTQNAFENIKDKFNLEKNLIKLYEILLVSEKI